MSSLAASEHIACPENYHKFPWRDSRLQELLAPVVEAIVAIWRLLWAGMAHVLHPVLEQLLIFFQHQILAKYSVRLQNYICMMYKQQSNINIYTHGVIRTCIYLIETRLDQASTKCLANSSEFCDRFLSHRFRYEVSIFLCGSRHFCLLRFGLLLYFTKIADTIEDN